MGEWGNGHFLLDPKNLNYFVMSFSNAMMYFSYLSQNIMTCYVNDRYRLFKWSIQIQSYSIGCWVWLIWTVMLAKGALEATIMSSCHHLDYKTHSGLSDWFCGFILCLWLCWAHKLQRPVCLPDEPGKIHTAKENCSHGRKYPVGCM